jgi:hypothetical protein
MESDTACPPVWPQGVQGRLRARTSNGVWDAVIMAILLQTFKDDCLAAEMGPEE